MTPTTLLAIWPAVVWLAAALLCLLLEAAGTPVGARKRGERTHLPWVIALAGAVVVARAVSAWPGAASASVAASGVVFDRAGLLSASVIAVLVVAAHFAAVPSLRALDEERGEMSAAFAVFGAALSLIAVANDLVVLGGGVVLSAVALALLAAPDRDGPHGIEASTKGVVGAGVILALLGLACVFAFAAGGDTSFGSLGRIAQHHELALPGIAFTVVALGLVIGAVPLHQAFVDVAHGSAAAAGSVLAGGTVVAAGAATLRFVDALAPAVPLPTLALAWGAFAALTLGGAPIAALDQSRIGRVVAYVVAVPGGLVLAAAAAGIADADAAAGAWRAGTAASVAGALGSAAVLLGAAVPRLPPSSTWEDWAGFGRQRPVVAALLLYALGTVVGVPGTIGFDARLDVARAAFDAGLDALGLTVVASAALGAAPLVRLALFLYAKDPPPRRERPPDRWALLLVGAFATLVVVSAVLAGMPSLLDDIVRACRR